MIFKNREIRKIKSFWWDSNPQPLGFEATEHLRNRMPKENCRKRFLSEELGLKIDKSLLWSDSMSVIRDIRNTAARFKTFVANRFLKFMRAMTWRIGIM